MLKCNWKAVVASALLFAFPYALVVLLTGVLVQSESTRMLFAFVAYATFPVIVALIAVGYIAARLAGASGVANGAAAGLLLAFVLLAGPYVSFNIDMYWLEYIRVYGPHALVMGVFWCSLGGLIRELLREFRMA